jgi:hypothetical protein
MSPSEIASGTIICGGDVCAKGRDQVNNEGKHQGVGEHF